MIKCYSKRERKYEHSLLLKSYLLQFWKVRKVLEMDVVMMVVQQCEPT